jgi:pyruvate dehydrogenase E2 component (dihydrolipoamide acetyltransferase)
MALKEIHVPDIGDFKDVPIIEVLAKPGDSVKAEQSLITVESDKSTMEIPSPIAGVLKELKVKLGDTVNTGMLIAVIEEGAAAAPAQATAPAPAPAPVPVPTLAPAPAPTPSVGASASAAASPQPSHPAAAIIAHAPSPDSGGAKPHASPSVRKFARELGVDLGNVTGSAPKGRVTHEDVQAFVKRALAGGAGSAHAAASGASGGVTGGGSLNLLPWPQVDFSKFGPVESVPLSRIKKISGANLSRNWVMIPHVTQHDEADVTELEAFRKDTNEAIAKSGVKLTMLAFIIKAAVAALKKYPDFNSSLVTSSSGDNLVRKQYWNIGFAADTPNGLVVPVIKAADTKGVLDIAKELGDLSALARDGKLKPTDMQGATFTISSLGGIGGTAFTPIINAPEVAILGVSKSAIKPVWDGQAFQPRLMLPLSLSYDHRVIDGAAGARFAAHMAQLLSDMRKVLL